MAPSLGTTVVSRTRTILHVDMDAFYASVEQHDDPSLLGKPVIVGGLGRRGVVATCSYEARPFGVRSAMPIGQARRLCPEGVYLFPRMSRYAEVSAQVFAVLGEITPEIEGLSLDEAFLDVSDSRRLFGSAVDMGRRIKARVLEMTGLRCSVGVSHNKWLAKLATELGKPDGLFEITQANRETLLDPLPVGRLWTVGKVAQEKLERVGMRTIGDVRRADPRLLRRAVGNHADLLVALANGHDERAVAAEREDRSISAETTFAVDLQTLDQARAWLLALSERVGERVRRSGLRGRVVTVKLRTPPFHTETRQTSLAAVSDSTDEIHVAARLLLERWWQERRDPRLRLLGVSLAGFDDAPVHGDLFADAMAPRKDSIADSLNRRFGKGTLMRARTLARPADDD
jgi:DNA polymerase-4